MNRKRILAVAKLLLLFGAPLAILVGLFSCGVYVGSTHREGITEFERDWLGLDVEVPGRSEIATPDAKGARPEPAKPEPAKPEPDRPEPDASQPEKPEPIAPRQPRPAATEPAPTPAAAPPATVIPEEPVVDPLAGPLAERLAVPVTVSLKVLVDAAVIERHPDWIDYVQRTVSEASGVYREQFGIELRLVSVGRWPVPLDGMGAGQLLDDLRARPRESGDVLVGLTGRPFDDHVSGRAETPAADSPFNGSHAVVYEHPRSERPHVRTLLHELGHVLGALDVTDPGDAAYRGRSFMSYAPATDRDAPWIDAANRERILQRKDLPFSPDAEQQ